MCLVLYSSTCMFYDSSFHIRYLSYLTISLFFRCLFFFVLYTLFSCFALSFSCVQDDGEPVPEGEDEDECPEDCEMTYAEFLEALAAVSCFYKPDPYICLEQRLEVFFLTNVVDHITPKMIRQFKQRQTRKKESKRKMGK